MSVQFCHETLAESHYLPFRLALGVEIGTAFAPAHGQPGKRIFQHLLKSQELYDAQADARMEAKAALVRAYGTVELDPVTLVHPHSSRIIDPRDAEHDYTLRFTKPLQYSRLLIFRIRIYIRLQRSEYLSHGLVEFRLIRIFLYHVFQYPHRIRHGHYLLSQIKKDAHQHISLPLMR